MSNLKRHSTTLAMILGLLTTTAYADNLVVNGSFEEPVVDHTAQWNIYQIIPGWQIERGPSIELQRGVYGWQPAVGDQWLELDSDIDGPNGSMHGEDASTAVFQNLDTVVGQDYELSFAFSPRPGVSDNVLEITWDGQVLDTLTADGSGLCNTDWQYYTYAVTATADTTVLGFGDRSVSDSLGTFVDDVSVVVPEPASLILLTIGLIVAARRQAS
ncbi:MAG: DUF642 domain-containing protein [Planctomycetes bacterium]|nr:DUF642 domain-containing protein [Planctomycetota bacterium]